MGKRVVVTGAGLVTPLGHDADTIWKRMLNGESGVRSYHIVRRFKFCHADSRRSQGLGRDEIEKTWTTGNIKIVMPPGVGAAYKAMQDAGLLGEGAKHIDPERLGVYTRRGEGTQSFDDFSAMMLAGLDDEGNLDEGKFVQKESRFSTLIASLNRNRICPRPILPQCSTLKVRTLIR